MSVSTLTHIALGLLALVGAAAIAVALMLASPCGRRRRSLRFTKARCASTSPARRIQPLPGPRRDLARLPALSGDERSEGSDCDPGARLVRQLDRNARLATALADGGVTAVAVDIRGHGASGTRGDIAYRGQLDDDLADLIGELRKADPAARFSLIGHSAGGGFALRIAGSPLGDAFDRFVLLAPYLGYSAPTNRPAEGPGSWALPDTPRIVATLMLERIGIDWPQSLPAHRLRQRAGGENVRDQPIFLPPDAELYRAARLERRVRARQRPHFRRRRAPTMN